MSLCLKPDQPARVQRLKRLKGHNEKDELTKALDYCVYCLKYSSVPVWVETFCGAWTSVTYLETSYQA